MFRLFIFSCLFASSLAATICVGVENQRLRPLVPGSCFAGTIFTDDNFCCSPEGVQTVGGGVVTSSTMRATTRFNGMASTTRFNVLGTTARMGGCVDLVNPRTGVSDCPARAAYCQNPTYYTLMTVQCPRTCNRCSTNTNRGNTGCVDLLNPRTGTSDCPQRVSYCKDPNYAQVMRVQCPRTCGMCSSTGTGSGGITRFNGINNTTPSTLNGNCLDQINPNTRKSDCPSLRALCTSSVYRTLMRMQCPATCGFCGSNQISGNFNGFPFG